jgi:hypothetical protein
MSVVSHTESSNQEPPEPASPRCSGLAHRLIHLTPSLIKKFTKNWVNDLTSLMFYVIYPFIIDRSPRKYQTVQPITRRFLLAKGGDRQTLLESLWESSKIQRFIVQLNNNGKNQQCSLEPRKSPDVYVAARKKINDRIFNNSSADHVFS